MAYVNYDQQVYNRITVFYDPAWVERGGQRSGMGVVSKWLSGYLPVQAEFPDCEVGPMHGFDHSKWRGGTGAGESWSAYRTEVGSEAGEWVVGPVLLVSRTTSTGAFCFVSSNLNSPQFKDRIVVSFDDRHSGRRLSPVGWASGCLCPLSLVPAQFHRKGFGFCSEE